ncbi:unnamed protein product, partial [Amoebophrya sp. A120]|eukprot:GSA120T00012293001.1
MGLLFSSSYEPPPGFVLVKSESIHLESDYILMEKSGPEKMTAAMEDRAKTYTEHLRRGE